MKSHRSFQKNTGPALKSTEITGMLYNNEALRQPSVL